MKHWNIGVPSSDHLVKCDECEHDFEPHPELTFIGDISGGTEFSPFVGLTKLCETCYQEWMEEK